MGIVVYSLLWVMQDIYYQPYHELPRTPTQRALNLNPSKLPLRNAHATLQRRSATIMSA